MFQMMADSENTNTPKMKPKRLAIVIPKRRMTITPSSGGLAISVNALQNYMMHGLEIADGKDANSHLKTSLKNATDQGILVQALDRDNFTGNKKIDASTNKTSVKAKIKRLTKKTNGNKKSEVNKENDPNQMEVDDENDPV